MAKLKIKELITSLKERFSHHKTELEKANEEYEKERKSAQGIKVNKNFGPRSKTQNGDRDISAI